MRVIAGSLKGRRLEAPTWPGLRPTSDKLRETLFNVLAPRIAHARVLDGYAGTGAVGIEAISRGAAWATFVDDDRRAEALIAKNLARCGVTDRYAIIRASIECAFDTLGPGRANEVFDVVFLDPPYALTEVRIAAVLERAGALLAAQGVVVLEHDRKRNPPDEAGRLARARLIVSGDSALTIYEGEGNRQKAEGKPTL